MASHFVKLFDSTATRDYANLKAVADVVVDGKTVISQAPVPFLIWLEKQLVDIHTVFSKLPTLDPAEDWSVDSNTGLYKTPVKKTARQVKETKVITLAPATDKHPAQVTTEAVNKIVGFWNTTQFSGAFSRERVKTLVDRVTKLQTAVKYAREQANSIEAPDQKVGEAIFKYLLSNT